MKKKLMLFVSIALIVGSFPTGAAAQTAAPTIELINPDGTTSNEISDRFDGEDAAYPLVAWVSNAPTSAVVQFKYTPSGTNQPTINIVCSNTGTQNALQVTADTYECDWDLQGIADGSGTVRAELYSAGSKIAEDQEPVRINSTGQTVEIVYPRQGQAVGFYTGPDGIATAMIDVITSGANADDAGANDVVVYYSMSAPGTEPAFTFCGSDETTGGAQDSIRCDLPADDPDTDEREDDPSRVTAIAAVAAENGPVPGDPTGEIDVDRDPDAADAHRAFGYEQQPGTVTVTPQMHDARVGSCSQIISAQVLDTNGRRIVGINTDVHAAGPTDNLFFDEDDTSGNNTSRSKAADNHPTQPAADCEDAEPPTAFRGTQGFHAQVDADIKHIESINAGGTDENGRFTFQLYSVDAGPTQFTVWADANGNDVCNQGEPAGIGSIGWNQAAPTPTGVAGEPCTQPPPPTACSDGVDNDGDGLVDSEDPGCESPEDDDESHGVRSGPCRGYEEGSRNPKPDGSPGQIIVGTSGPDFLRGTDGDDVICGLGGKDSIRGRDGGDRLFGGGGHDDIRGNAGPDVIRGNNGLDILRGGLGHDVTYGGDDNDTMNGYKGRDRLRGGAGDDTLRAGDGNDNLKGHAGDDFLGGGRGSDRCRGGPGNDRIAGCER